MLAIHCWKVLEKNFTRDILHAFEILKLQPTKQQRTICSRLATTDQSGEKNCNWKMITSGSFSHSSLLHSSYSSGTMPSVFFMGFHSIVKLNTTCDKKNSTFYIKHHQNGLKFYNFFYHE